MSTSDELQSNTWWAEGDTPIHTDSRVTYLVDGHTTMLTMCRHFLMAQKYIYLANWGISPTMELVRGKDHRAGSDGSLEQEALLAELRAEGLQEAEIDFWCSHDLTVQAILGYMVGKGIEVKVLLWDSPEIFTHYNPKAAYQEFVEVRVTCMLDDCSRGIIGIANDLGIGADFADAVNILGSNGTIDPCRGTPFTDVSANGKVDLNDSNTIDASDSCAACFFGRQVIAGVVQ